MYIFYSGELLPQISNELQDVINTTEKKDLLLDLEEFELEIGMENLNTRDKPLHKIKLCD